MRVLRLIGVIVMLTLLGSSCVKDVSIYEQEIPQGRIMMKSLSPQRVSDELILELTQIVDYRCPVGVVCSAPGKVDINFQAYFMGDFHELTMSYDKLTNADGCSMMYEGHNITVYKVNPIPFVDVLIDPEDYTIEVEVIKD